MHMRITYGGIIFNQSFEILLVKGREHGKWSLPKGSREIFDKTEFDAAVREVYEETSINLLKYLVLPQKVLIGSINCFVAHVPNDIFYKPIDINEIEEIKFFTFDSFINLNTNKPTKLFAQKYKNLIKQIKAK